MSIDSWQDVLDTDFKHDPTVHAAAPDLPSSSSSSLSTNERQLELNFERFNQPNQNYSSSSDLSMTDHKPTHPSKTMNSVSLDDEPPTTSSHADSFATWTPSSTSINGASLPWLFTLPSTKEELDPTNDTSLRQTWNRIQQSTLRANPPPSSHTTPHKEDTPLEVINIIPTAPASNDQTVFYFSMQRDQKQALDSIMTRWTWETLRSLDLRHQHLTAIHHLATLTPLLETLIISFNQIISISGLPLTLKILKAKANRLTDIEGFRHLHKLEHLDVCDNALETFDGMGSFYYLKTLLAEHNKLSSCQGLQQMHALVKLKLRGNAIHRLTFGQASLYHLETLDVSYNRIQCLETLNGIPKLHELNLDRNEIERISLPHPIETLRILKLSHNRLRVYDGHSFPNLRTLYLDNNRLEHVTMLSPTNALDTLSIRDQQCGGQQQTQAHMKDLENTRKLYLSGMPVKQIDPRLHFTNLEYLEICGGQIEELPDDFASQLPQLRILYLSHNFLKQIKPLMHHRRLQKLILIDNRFGKLGPLLETVRTLRRLHTLDTRNNPINTKLYAELIYTDIVQAKDSSSYPLCRYLGPEYDTSWLSRDAAHAQGLPEHWQRRRTMYRALFLTENTPLAILDQVPVTGDEAAHAHTLVQHHHTSKHSSPPSSSSSSSAL